MGSRVKDRTPGVGLNLGSDGRGVGDVASQRGKDSDWEAFRECRRDGEERQTGGRFTIVPGGKPDRIRDRVMEGSGEFRRAQSIPNSESQNIEQEFEWDGGKAGSVGTIGE